jgi:hypothetical protein
MTDHASLLALLLLLAPQACSSTPYPSAATGGKPAQPATSGAISAGETAAEPRAGAVASAGSPADRGSSGVSGHAGAAAVSGSGGEHGTAGAAAAWRTANLTNFTSYPDPNSEECIKFNGCMWAGQFAAVDGVQPESWVMANNIVAVHAKDFAQYKLKTLRLQLGPMQIDAKVYDECVDSDCSGCCMANSKQTGFLIDIEKYTMQRFGVGDGVVDWLCLDCP